VTSTARATDQRSRLRSADLVRVMIVDDSVVVRGLLARWLEVDGDVRVVSSVADGAQAVAQLVDCKAEVIILDVDMPVMDGLEALPKLLAANPGVKIVMSSTLTRRNAQISFKALSLGASDCIAKPNSTRGVVASEEYRREIVERVEALGAAARGFKSGLRQNTIDVSAAPATAKLLRSPAVELVAPQVIAIGCSTGGPQALVQLLGKIGPGLTVPVFITQHMPETFTAILAEHLAKVSLCAAKEAQNGDSPEPGAIYIAPGGHHVLAQRRGGRIVLELDGGAPENFCRPAVDPMFRSVAAAYGSAAIAIVLTGMGRDGCEGARAIAAAGGKIIVQDQATSVVWGMPGAVAEAGLATAVLPIEEIGPTLIGLMKGTRP
jgi:two-component system chemotaxis response regulator CheB